MKEEKKNNDGIVEELILCLNGLAECNGGRDNRRARYHSHTFSCGFGSKIHNKFATDNHRMMMSWATGSVCRLVKTAHIRTNTRHVRLRNVPPGNCVCHHRYHFWSMRSKAPSGLAEREEGTHIHTVHTRYSKPFNSLNRAERIRIGEKFGSDIQCLKICI